MVGVGDGDESVVADFLLAVDLLPFDDADKPSANSDSWESWLIHEQEHVDGITVGRKGLREEAEVVRENHAGGQNFFEGEDALIGIEGKLVAAAGGGFDDDLEEAAFLVDGLEAGWIGESFHVRPDVESESGVVWRRNEVGRSGCEEAVGPIWTWPERWVGTFRRRLS
jgi:hypothetical protein